MIQETDRQDLKSPAKDDTNPFGHIAYKPKKKIKRWAIGLAIATISVLGLILIFISFSPDPQANVLPANSSKNLDQPLLSLSSKDRLAKQQRINEITARETVDRQDKEKASARLNSLYYIIGSYTDLQERKILIGAFLKTTRLGEIAPGQFRSAIDLRTQQRIRFSAASLHMERISGLAIFPRELNAGWDYGVNLGPLGRWAEVTILKKEVFHGRHMVIAAN